MGCIDLVRMVTPCQVFPRTAATANFGRPFTPRTWLRSPRNFGNARFRRFANFDFLTPIFFFRNFGFFFRLSLFSADFRGARLFLTSKSNSSRFFALDGQIFRSVRPLGLIFRFFTVHTSSCRGKARVTEIPEGAKPPRPPQGGKAWVTEIPEGGKPPQTPPRHHFKKFALQGQIF